MAFQKVAVRRNNRGFVLKKMYGCFGGIKNTDRTNEVTVRWDSTVLHLKKNHGENHTKLNLKTTPLKIE